MQQHSANMSGLVSAVIWSVRHAAYMPSEFAFVNNVRMCDSGTDVNCGDMRHAPPNTEFEECHTDANCLAQFQLCYLFYM